MARQQHTLAQQLLRHAERALQHRRVRVGTRVAHLLERLRQRRSAQVLVSVARASLKQQPGAYTLIELPIIDMLYGEKESLIKRLV